MQAPGRVVSLVVLLTVAVAASAQTATYHLHKEVSTINTSFDKLLTVGPDASSVALTTSLNGKAVGHYVIKEFETQSGVPGAAGVIPSGSTLSFAVWMRKTASAGAASPEVHVNLNSASGTSLCTAIGATALTTTVTQQNLSCSTTANITMSATDRFYLWVGVNLTATGSFSGELDIEGTLNGNFDSQITLPTATGAPTVTSLTPNTGAVGSSIVIAGTNFRSSQGSSTVKLNGTAATSITSWTATSITATVPSTATTGNVVVTVGGQASSGVSFTVTPAPSISSLTPNTGAVGSSIVIAGSNFGSSQGNGNVKFNGTTATISGWSATQITTIVPTGATTGNVVVTAAGGVASSGVSFTVTAAPSITSLTPNVGAVGSSIVIAGSNFGSSQGNGNVKFNGTTATVSGWSATQITATVPAGASTGNVVVTAAGGVASSGVSFTVTAAPSITSLTPNTGAVGSSIVIAGSNFGTAQGNGSVTFNGTAATVTSWGGTSITATVPTGATTGNVVVTAAGGVASNGVTFTVTGAPSISSLTPNTGAVGSSIVIAGSNFGPAQGSGTVKFNGTVATVTSWAASSITTTVPTGATTGNAVVTAAGGVASGGVSFTVTGAPSISSLTPSAGPVGTSVNITGLNFGPSQGSGTVTFNGTTAAITSWGASSITTTVPAGATAGNVVVTAAGGVSSAGANFTVTVPPSITSLTPSSGEPGASITIAGSNFTATTGTVTFNGTPASISSWINTNIVALVPNGANSGNVVVTASGLQSNGVSFTVLVPSIASLNPTTGTPGTSVTISGSNFGTSAGTVTFGGQSAAVNSWSDSSIQAVVPSAASTGLVVVNHGGLQSNGVTFTVQELVVNGPVTYSYDELGRLIAAIDANGNAAVYNYDAVGNILSISRIASTQASVISFRPSRGSPGTLVTIYGTGFSATASQDTVSFNGASASIASASSSQLVVTVPAGATTGPISVTSPAGSATSASNFTVTTGSAPTITSFTPTIGVAGTAVSVTGTNFDPSTANDHLLFNISKATVTSATVTSLATTAPAATGSGRVSLEYAHRCCNQQPGLFHSVWCSCSGRCRVHRAGGDWRNANHDPGGGQDRPIGL